MAPASEAEMGYLALLACIVTKRTPDKVFVLMDMRPENSKNEGDKEIDEI